MVKFSEFLFVIRVYSPDDWVHTIALDINLSLSYRSITHSDRGYGKMGWRTLLLHGVCVDQDQGIHWRRQDEDGVHRTV